MEEARQLHIQLNDMTSRGGFQLRKWASNYTEVLDGVPEENFAIRSSEGITLNPDPSVKALGLTWYPKSDVFRFQFEIPKLNPGEVHTKRQVLAIIATLFDPLLLRLLRSMCSCYGSWRMKTVRGWTGTNHFLRWWVSLGKDSIHNYQY